MKILYMLLTILTVCLANGFNGTSVFIGIMLFGALYTAISLRSGN